MKDENKGTGKAVFTPEQIKALLSKAKGDWKGVILFGYFTGLRLSDITELRWKSVGLETGVLRLIAKKTGKTVTIPLLPELVAWMALQPRGIGQCPVFPSLAGKSSGTNGLSARFVGIMEAAGIVPKVTRAKVAGGKGRSQNDLSFHSLRHSFNSALANAGVSQEMRQKLTGHASASMNDRYTHHEIQNLREAMGKLPGIV